MPCYTPLSGWRAREVNPKTGKRRIVFNQSEGFADMRVDFACGQCIGCRIERSRHWAIRCVHEASLYEDNCFITLTYSPQHLPADGSLCLEHFQKFMKRLRKKFAPRIIRFFHCGEYGETFERPHYHACLFNFDLLDRVLFKRKDNICLYTSEILQALWPYGFVTVGNVTFESAAYVARYIMKKITGEHSDGWYAGRKPEYITMSRRPGIGADWYKKFSSDVFPSDEVVLNGKVLTVPKFYAKLLEIDRVAEFERIKRKRKAKALERSDDNTFDRLRVREQVKRAQLRQLKRGYEHG